MGERQPRALFGNAAFEVVGGSELVIMELAELLLARGWACDVVAWSVNDPMRTLAGRAGLTVLNDPAAARPLTYDLAWIQNRVEPAMDYDPGPDEAPRTLFAFAHLDRSWSLAQPGVVAERALGGLFVTPSDELMGMLVAEGLPAEAIRVFRNAAPPSFDMPPPPAMTEPRTLLVVSNHAPIEVHGAIRLLRAEGVMVTHWGQGGDMEGLRLTPRAVSAADGVVSIGKTVPYAIRAHRPVYVYDHFGGPGWLMEEGFDRAAAFNFSGRCCGRRLDAEAIAAEIMGGYGAAAAEAAGRGEARMAPFRLEAFLDDLLALAAVAPEAGAHRARLAADPVALRAERHLATAAGTYFAAAMRGHRHYLAARAGGNR